MKRLTILLLLIIPFSAFSFWGFFAHQRINQLAIFGLPQEMIRFYKANRSFITLHAVSADKRRYVDSLEAPRHYLDVELYASHLDSIPRKWAAAVQRYGLHKLQQYGTVPWHIEKVYYNLVSAFKQRDSLKILRTSADLGHYIADAHVPLHTTHNHNGQLTQQTGIHAFWESTLPELFSRQYNLAAGKAVYIESPLMEAWKIVTQSHSLVRQTLLAEAQLSHSYPPDQKYSYVKRKGQVVKQHAHAYAKAYQQKLNGMVENRMRASVHAISSFWYSAWIDAGQPPLQNLNRRSARSEKAEDAQLEKSYSKGKIKGREY